MISLWQSTAERLRRCLPSSPISITCYDRNGDVIRDVTSDDGGNVEEGGNNEDGTAQQYTVNVAASPSNAPRDGRRPH